MTRSKIQRAMNIRKENREFIQAVDNPEKLATCPSDEFGSIRYETASKQYKVGDKLELIVPHCDPVVNEYDVLYGTRQDRVEVVWPISARGKSQ